MPSCTEPITVVRYTPLLQAVWDSFVAGCKNATFLFERGYIDYNPRFIDYSLLFYKGSELVALLPACLCGDVLASHGGLTYGGFLYGCNVGTEQMLALFDALLAYLRRNTEVKKVVTSGKPVFGIGLGHLELAVANGAEIIKLKYGHRGASQPVLTFETGRTYITTQNHGYAVENISSDVAEISHINGNDKTCEGIKYNNIPAFSVQFRPETCGGPQDTSYLYDRFIKMMEGK